jgi:hypothetical protein
MSLRINDEAPNFTAQTTQGEIDFHKWIGEGWAILFSHPKDFTPVCTTELGYMAKLEPDFAARNCKIIALSVDPVSSHGKTLKPYLRVVAEPKKFQMSVAREDHRIRHPESAAPALIYAVDRAAVNNRDSYDS